VYISHTIATERGRALVSHPRGLTIPDDPAAALAFAVQQDRAADVLLAEGRFEAAERLSHAALEARARATGCRA
jgi:hypothetical protein